MSNKSFKKGFTQTEFIYTCFILGALVVATLPVLINTYQKKLYVNQFKGAYNTAENGFKLCLVEDGADTLHDTELFKTIEGGSTTDSEEMFEKFTNVLGKYFKIIKKEYKVNNMAGYKYLNDTKADIDGKNLGVIYLENGSKLFIDLHNEIDEDTSTVSIGGTVEIDTNADSGPNVIGRDKFYFNLDQYGKLRPEGTGDDCNTGSTGKSCAVKLLSNGWNMDY